MDSNAYDFVIVGAGSAGCVLANRLSENPKNKVLLIEAGGSDRKFWIRVPLGYAMTFADPKVNWCYTAAADPGLNNREGYFPRGKVIGGSSSINAMAYLRGLPHDFDDWEAAGANGWGWNNVEQVYNTLETRSEFSPDGSPVHHGSGPVVVSDLSNLMHPFAERFLSAASDMGWPVSKDLNGTEKEGLTLVRSTVRQGRRWSSADAFLTSIRKRRNLRVITNAHVEQLHMENGQATELSYRIGNQLQRAKAGKEIILSAGAINSPQLLQLSGIGAPDMLKTHGIEAVTEKRLTPDVVAMNDRELLENFRSRAGSVFHASCTCRMGNDASDSVVDERLRVHGVRGLRVIDASAFPNVTSGNTNAPTLMLAAKAAELILEDAAC